MTKRSYNNIAENVKRVRERIEKAAAKAGRSPEEITLVGVTKTRTADEVRELIRQGVSHIGENRVQELLAKKPFLEDCPHTTHLIGHLQRNKAKYLPGAVDMVQSVAAIETAEALEKAFAPAGVLDVLIEVNIGGEASKSGASPAAVSELAARIMQSGCLRLRGLMAIPPFVQPEAVRKHFERMRQLFVDIKAKKADNISVNVLSMGMSSDFEYAILEGATMVRVGTDLFGPRQ